MEDFTSSGPPDASRWGELFIGIDPGTSGGIAMLSHDTCGTQIVLLADAPSVIVKKTRHEMDAPAMVAILRRARDGADSPFACIEWSQSMPKQGIVSTFNYGVGFGMWLGILTALEIPFIKVRPQDWKKEMLHGYDYSGGNKNVSIVVAENLYPGANIGKRKDAGRAEALLMATFAMRTYLGGKGRDSNE